MFKNVSLSVLLSGVVDSGVHLKFNLLMFIILQPPKYLDFFGSKLSMFYHKKDGD